MISTQRDTRSAHSDDQGRWSRRIERAELDLKNAISDYEAAMAAVVEEQRRARVTTLLSVLSSLTALGRAITERRDDFSLLGPTVRRKPCVMEDR